MAKWAIFFSHICHFGGLSVRLFLYCYGIAVMLFHLARAGAQKKLLKFPSLLNMEKHFVEPRMSSISTIAFF